MSQFPTLSPFSSSAEETRPHTSAHRVLEGNTIDWFASLEEEMLPFQAEGRPKVQSDTWREQNHTGLIFRGPTFYFD